MRVFQEKEAVLSKVPPALVVTVAVPARSEEPNAPTEAYNLLSINFILNHGLPRKIHQSDVLINLPLKEKVERTSKLNLLVSIDKHAIRLT